MYESFFKLREKPFSLLPDPGFIYLSPKHQEALTILEYGLLNQAGFIVLTGEIGVGKTTLMRCLLDRLDESFTIGLISHTHQSLGNLMEWVCSCFDLRADRGQSVDPHQVFEDFVIDQYAKGKRTLLIVDEAQNLGSENLEHLRLLSNINSDKNLVLQLMLLGQPQLRDLLRQPKLQQFVQRVAASYHLGQLGETDTERYIRHRIAVAGGEAGIFTAEACKAVFEYSKGVPRLINLICDTALVYAYAAESRTVTPEIVDEFVEAQGAHLLVPLERPAEYSRSRSHPRPIETQDHANQDYEEGPGSIVASARRYSTQIDAASPAADRDESVRQPPLLRSQPAGLDSDAIDRVPKSGTSPEAHTESKTGTSEDIGPWISARVRGQGADGLQTWLGATSVGAGTPSRDSSSARIAGVADAPTRMRRHEAMRRPASEPAQEFVQTPAGASVHLDARTKRTPVIRWFVLAAGVGLLVLLAAGLVFKGGGDTWASLREFVDRATWPDMTLPLDQSVQKPRDAESKGSADGASGPLPGQPEVADRAASGVPTGARPTITDHAAQQQAPDVSPAPDGTPELHPAPQLPTNEPGGGSSAPPTAEMRSSAFPSSTEETSAPRPATDDTSNSASGDSAASKEVFGTSAASLDPSTGLVSQTAPVQNPSDANMETVNQDVIDPREDGGTGVEFESRLDEASLDKSSPNASSQQASTDSAMARLETELLALGVAVERTDADHLIANLGDNVQFSDGSVTLDADAQAFLEVIAEDLKKSLPLKVRVIGHTDHRGRADVNARLSAKRAENVAQFLEANGIADKSLSYVGRGESEPKISLVDERKLGPAVNRRIELELFTPSPNEEPLFAAGVGLWAAALALVSAFSAMPIFVRATGAIASIMFAVTAVQIYDGAALNLLSKPLPFYAYPFLVLTIFGWAWVHFRSAARAAA